jgi:hypothetical protein
MKNLISIKETFLFLSAITSITFMMLGSACKPKDTRPYGPRYEEDPGPERGTVSERLNGVWKIEDYLLNEASIINQASVATSGSISIKDVHWDYYMPTKDNDWRESYLVYPWKWYGLISKDSIGYDGYDTSFCYWFIDPFIKSNNRLHRGWSITKLYGGSLHVKLINNRGTYKIYWKK